MQDQANPGRNSQVKTETTADLNVVHERRSKIAAEAYERRETELKRGQEEDKAQLTETFQAAQDVLKVKGPTRPPAAASTAFSAAFVLQPKAEMQQLTAELRDYKQLRRRVQESTFNKDLQRNIQVTPPVDKPGTDPPPAASGSDLSVCRPTAAPVHSGSPSRSRCCSSSR